MAANTVYVFAKAAPSAVTHLAEIRSAVEKGGKTISTMQVKIFKASAAEQSAAGGRVIRTTLPYIRSDIPVVVVFRALGIISDRDILDHIIYDRSDTELYEMMKPSIEEAFPIDEQDVRLPSVRLMTDPLTHLNRPRSTSLVAEAPPPVSAKSAVCAMPKRFSKRRCCPMSLCSMGSQRRRPTSSAT